MAIPVDITFHGLESSPAAVARINELADGLETAYSRIMRLDVAVEAPHRSGRKGNRYHVRIKIEVPGADVIVSRDPGDVDAHEDLHVAIRDAFKAVRRQLEDYVARNLRREVKRKIGPAHGRIAFLDVERAWGHLEDGDGRRIYFHRNAVVGDPDQLELGAEVRFEEEPGNEGPQASSVTPIGANGRHEAPA